ncbi:hypothetical protein BDW42DRAFT_190446 [Aspergillus taichungensis]|uniref:Cyanovirin-N domain-containing protein n=1 Tax=Aspergillus taichungensis TaxID=482145 RepID=A0A2J5I804_9EURO|nr:hypothetical protein BDW42DRAFT_190446 [Aspergillus taichungensis]
MLRKSLLLGLSIHLAPALAGPLSSRAGPSEFELGDPYYLCLRDDGSIDRGAKATCDAGSSAAKLNDIREGSSGDVEFFYVDESNPSRNHVLNLDCAGGGSSSVTVTEIAPPTTITQFETDTITQFLPPATVTATVTGACSDNSWGNGGYGNNGYDNNGYDNNGYDNNGYDNNGYDNNGYDNNGYDNNDYGYNGGYGNNGYDNNGYNNNGYNNNGYNNNGYNNNGYNNNGYSGNGY